MEFFLNGIIDPWFPRSDLCSVQVDFYGELGMMGYKHHALDPLLGAHSCLHCATGDKRISCREKWDSGPQWPRSGSAPLFWHELFLDHVPCLLFCITDLILCWLHSAHQSWLQWVDPYTGLYALLSLLCELSQVLISSAAAPSAGGIQRFLTVQCPLSGGDLEYCFVKKKLISRPSQFPVFSM